QRATGPALALRRGRLAPPRRRACRGRGRRPCAGTCPGSRSPTAGSARLLPAGWTSAAARPARRRRPVLRTLPRGAPILPAPLSVAQAAGPERVEPAAPAERVTLGRVGPGPTCPRADRAR